MPLAAALLLVEHGSKGRAGLAASLKSASLRVRGLVALCQVLDGQQTPLQAPVEVAATRASLAGADSDLRVQVRRSRVAQSRR